MDSMLKEIRKNAFKRGLILGLAILVLDIISLYAWAQSNSVLVMGFAYFFNSFIFPLIAAIVLIKSLRKETGGYWSLRQATSGIFVMFLTATVISSTGNFVFIKYLQPNILVQAKNNLMNVLSSFLSGKNVETAKIDQMMNTIEEQFAAFDKSSFGVFISNLLSSIIILFIVALVFAAFFKREEPSGHLNHPNPKLS